jgi:hypothetical protein
MKKILLFTASFTLLVISFSSCKKNNEDVATIPVDDAAALTDLFTRNLVPSQNFTVDNAVGLTVTTAKGSRITFPPSCFMLANGTIATGNVAVEYKEIVDKVDYVLSNKGTISGDLPLESAGTWMLKPTQATNVLRINPAAKVLMNIRRDSAVGGLMDLFNAPAAGNNAGAINWGPKRAQLETLATPFNNFFCALDSVGWGNADRFLTNPSYAMNTKVVASNGTNLNSFSAMFIYKGKKIVWPMYGRAGAAVTDSHVAKAQLGQVVVFGFVNGVFTTGILQDQTVTSDNQTFTVTLTTNTEVAFRTQLSAIL